MVEHCVATMLVQADRHIAENEVERNKKRILEHIRAAGAKGIRLNMLTRKVQYIESDARTKYIRDLIEAEQIVSFQRSTAGRAPTWFRVVELPPH